MVVLHTFSPPASAPLDPGASRSYKPKVNKASFGDGFSQRSIMGFNNNPSVRNLSWTNLTEDEADYIDNFLADRKGVESFFFQESEEHPARVFVCSEWTRTRVAYDVYSLTATFDQVYDLG